MDKSRIQRLAPVFCCSRFQFAIQIFSHFKLRFRFWNLNRFTPFFIEIWFRIIPKIVMEKIQIETQLNWNLHLFFDDEFKHSALGKIFFPTNFSISFYDLPCWAAALQNYAIIQFPRHFLLHTSAILRSMNWYY